MTVKYCIAASLKVESDLSEKTSESEAKMALLGGGTRKGTGSEASR